MSIMKKLKDILFEEEEYTEPIKVREKNKEEEKAIKIEIPEEDETVDLNKNVKSEREIFTSVKEFEEENPIKTKMAKEPERVEVRKDIRESNSFQFPDFDEEEFASSISRTKPSNNVLDYERKKEKRDYGRYERVENRYEGRESGEKKKFTPSPIISPVYGILNQDYKAEDIVNKKTDASNINIEEVRKKAFETRVKEEVTPKTTEESLDPVVTFFEEKDKNNKEEDYQTIDSLLASSAEEIPLEDTLEIPKTNNLDAIEEELEKIDQETKEQNQDIDDTLTVEEEKDPLDETLDSDLFELIDSMYDEREEG